jgi:hypothetical protein
MKKYDFYQPHLLRTLTIDSAKHPRGRPHLSAASGLVRVGKFWFLIADDELELAFFDGTTETSPIDLHAMLSGSLPDDKTERKKRKPDFEVLFNIEPQDEIPMLKNGALLVLGSGSKENTRERGVLLRFAAPPIVQSAHDELEPFEFFQPIELDLQALYAPLASHFSDLNIEGGFVFGDVVKLLQRGNQSGQTSACIEYDKFQFFHWLTRESKTAPDPLRIDSLTFDSVRSVPLSITDGAAVNEQLWVATVVAENTRDSYHDGACLASALVLLDQSNGVIATLLLQGAPKVEGICAQASSAEIKFTMVTDPDDPNVASQMLQLVIGPLNRSFQ